MGAPVAAARQSPEGIRLDDGHSTLVTFSADPDAALWEKSVTPPGIDGGDAIDTTTMHNVAWRSRAPRQLKTLTDFSMVCAYDPAVYTSILGLVNVNTTVTVTFPDGSTLAFFGYLRTLEFSEIQEGEQPEVTVTITPTNIDPADHEEAAPVLTSVSGT